MRRILYTLIILLFSTFAFAADQTYYVTSNGSGSQNGTSYANSWSISDFQSSGNWSASEDANKIDPGDTVYFCGSISVPANQSITVPGSGSSGNYITIDGNDGVHPATISTSSIGSYNAAFYMSGKSYLEFQNFTINGSAYDAFRAENSSSYLKFHDNTMSGSFSNGFHFKYSDHDIYIYNNSLTGTTNETSNAIHLLSGIYNLYIYQNYFIDWGHAGIDNSIAASRNHDIYLYNNKFTLPTKGYGRAFAFYQTDYAYIYNNYIYGMRARSQIDTSSYVYVHHNIFFNTMNCCQSAGDTGCSEAYYNCSTKAYYKTGQHLSIESSYGDSDHIYVYNNTFYKSSESALRLSDSAGNIDNVHISNNIFNEGSILSDPGDSPPGSTNTSEDRG